MEAATFSSRNKPPPPSYSKTANNAVFSGVGGIEGGLFATSYDDVFGGPPKFAAASTLAPRAEDYAEIFCCRTPSSSRTSSSIPVLDLPAVNAADFDGVDYSDIFGGINAVDFYVPFDELFRSFDGFIASDDEAWTPVGTESSDDSDPFAFSDKNQSFLNGNIHQPPESKQFNISYHKANPGMSSCVPNTMHVTQLNDVSAYTCVVDDATSLKEMGNERFCSPLSDDIVYSVEVPPVLSQKHTKKTKSDLSVDVAGSESFGGDHRSGRTCNASVSDVNSTSPSPSPSVINFIAKPVQMASPSRQLPVARNEGPSGLGSHTKVYRSCGLERTVDHGLPPLLDMEVDVTSSAFASAAAMKDAMEKAQAKFKTAKELRGRKYSFQNGGKVGSNTDLNGVENVALANNECVSEENQLHGTTGRETTKTKCSSKVRHGRQYYEFVNSDNPRLATQQPNNDDEKAAIPKQQDKGDDNSDSAGEAYAPEENRRRLKTTKPVSRQEYYKKMVKVAQAVHDTVTGGHTETNVGLKGRSQVNRKEQKPEFINEWEKSEVKVWEARQAELIPVEAYEKRKAIMKSNNVLENEEVDMRETNASYRDQNGGNINSLQKNMAKGASNIEDGERRVRGSFEVKTAGRVVHEAMLRECQQRTEEAYEKPWNEREVAETLTQKHKERREEKDNRSKEAAEDVFCGEGLQVTHENQDNYKMQDLQQMEAEDERPKKVVEDVFAQDRMERTFEGLENDLTSGLQQRYELEEHLEEDTGGDESAKMPYQYVELEKCWEYLEDLEQVKTRLNLDESPEPTFDIEHSAKIQKQDENKGPEDAESKFTEAGELQERKSIIRKTDSEENQNGPCRNQPKTEWEDEGQDSDSSSDKELPIDDKHQELSNGSNLNEEDVELDALPLELRKTLEEVNGSLEVSSQRVSGESAAVLSNGSMVETTRVLIDERKTKATVVQVGPIGSEVERTAVHASHGIPKMVFADVCVEVSARQENGEIGTAPSDESTLKYPDTTNGVSDELSRSEVHPSHTPQANAEICKSSGNCSRNEYSPTDKAVKISQSDSDPLSGKNPTLEHGRLRSQGLGHVPHDQKDNVRTANLERTNGWDEPVSRKEVAHTFEADRKENSHKMARLPHLGQSIGRKGKSSDHDSSLEAKGDEKKKDMEKDHLRKLEEEREREKDRMAVEIAMREARERAYSDARDRAERAALEKATVEARERAIAEARDRLEKACAEARETSSVDNSSEARLRAEHAAVERATLEARQRAIEKAMVERATFEARERLQRSVSEKYVSERDVMMRQSSFPSTSDGCEAADGEPAQRCKARLERHQRTVERVAKAVAEKNTRDLLAQREQAERKRFAETLDADIKRWSSGKAGNLRALLSTLQYILGPDSGWQPIPLTEVITAAAVKKAYRKATLCVHPDKLQQRGATIQQKYICEKVFDLLKEAWNRFNSEEK